MNSMIYLDNQATTPLDERVLQAMLPYFREQFGNAASKDHVYGNNASRAVEKARAMIAGLIGAEPEEIIFTSGATESDNLAIKGGFEANRKKGNHIITVVTEHKAVLDTCKHLEKQGTEVTWLGVGKDGLIDLDELAGAIREDTVLVSIMMANNEIGVIQPIREIGALCRDRGVLFHTDATQGVGKIPVNVREMNIDLMSLSAHKMYGPKGVGALFVSRKPRARVAIQMHGGGHERGLRSGTLNVPGIVGFGEAARLAGEVLQDEMTRLTGLRNLLRDKVLGALPEVHLNGHPDKRIPGNLNLSFAFVEGESLMLSMPNVAVSSGSACTSATLKPSYVLEALGQRTDLIHTSIRFGLGRFTTREEVEYVADKVIESVTKLRELSPLWDMHLNGIDINSIDWGDHAHH